MVGGVRDRPPSGRGRAAALVVLAVAAGAGWWPVLGAGELWAIPIVAVAALVALRVLRMGTAAVLLAAWVPTALLLAGVPLSGLRPAGWDDSAGSLLDGLDALTVPSRGRVGADPWPLAGALLVTGVAWIVAAAMTTVRGRAAALVALVLPALPLVWALALEQTADAAWPGAALLAAGVLGAARGRLAALVPATAVVALVAAVGGQALGPDERWIPFVDAAGRDPQFSRLETTQSYGPLNDRRTGATMLEVSATEPALWRMQVLERFSGRWGVDVRPEPNLPQPAAEPVTTTVRVKGLRNRLVAAPGRVESVDGRGGSYVENGESRQLKIAPEPDDVYRVTSSVVRASVKELEAVQIPTGPQYDEYIETWSRRSYPRRTRPAIEELDRLRENSGPRPFVRAVALARDLAAGASGQLEVVRRVQSYLLDGDRFRYTTDVPEPGSSPLIDFLMEDRAGYCQQFAGAAAMLLRFAGVPTRVVTGFATGESDGDGTFTVRDRDAHAWIEVYFPGFGWVPFNPTPAAADADVDESLDLLAAAGTRAGDGGGAPGALLLVPVVGVAVVVGLRARRRRRGDLPAPVPTGELLARLVPGDPGPATTLTGLRPGLRRIGPSVAALAEAVERARFSGESAGPDRHPRLRVWRALRRDVGPARATLLVARHRVRPSRPSS